MGRDGVSQSETVDPSRMSVTLAGPAYIDTERIGHVLTRAGFAHPEPVNNGRHVQARLRSSTEFASIRVMLTALPGLMAGQRRWTRLDIAAAVEPGTTGDSIEVARKVVRRFERSLFASPYLVGWWKIS